MTFEIEVITGAFTGGVSNVEGIIFITLGSGGWGSRDVHFLFYIV